VTTGFSLPRRQLVWGHFLCSDFSTRKRRPKLRSLVIETLSSRHCSLSEVCDKLGPAHFDPVISCDRSRRNAEYRMKPKTRWDAFTLLEWLKRTDKNSQRFAHCILSPVYRKVPVLGIRTNLRRSTHRAMMRDSCKKGFVVTRGGPIRFLYDDERDAQNWLEFPKLRLPAQSGLP
jgi:hypothetical protein